MPLLKFQCKDCEKIFETLCSVSEMDSVRCDCGGEVARAYEGKCLFGSPGSSAGRGGQCSGECGGCAGCASHG